MLPAYQGNTNLVKEFVQTPVQRLLGAPQVSAHGLRPNIIPVHSVLGPAGGRVAVQVPAVAQLVGYLDLPGPGTRLEGFLDLDPFPFDLGQAFIVGALDNQLGDGLSELLCELLCGGLGVLERVVQDRGAEGLQVGDAGIGEDPDHLQGVVDVGDVAVLAALAAVLQGCEVEGARKYC